MTAEHTRGPWKVGTLPVISGKYAGCYAIAPAAGPAFAVLIGGGPADLRRANGRLIEAAPDLLGSLERIVGLARHLPHFAPREYDANSDEALREMCDALREAVETAEAAIARAKGATTSESQA